MSDTHSGGQGLTHAQEIDFLFASKSPFVWETEKRFRELKAEHPEFVRSGQMMPEKGDTTEVEVEATAESKG